MALQAWRLSPRSAFHLGREGLSQETSAETFPSDSLFAALVAQTALLYGRDGAESLLASFNGALPFRLSSLFPIIGGVPLFPRPFLPPIGKPGAQQPAQYGDSTRKRLKKLAYVSSRVLQDALSGGSLADQIDSGLLLHSGRILIAREEAALLPGWLRRLAPDPQKRAELWSAEPVTRVTVDRVTNASLVYRVGRTLFAPDCGLWLLADVHAYADELETLLTHLSDTGIGGERSAGYGGFTLESLTPPAVKIWQGQPNALTLSRYNPTLEELQAGVLKGASYELVDVGGWLNAPGSAAQRRQRVRMIEAGAYLNTRGLQEVQGRILDVRPSYAIAGAPVHPVIRSGVPLCLAVGR